MTAYALQKDLEEEIEEILKDIILKDVDGGTTKLKAFSQELPKRMQEVKGDEVMPEEDPEEDPYPYCVVRVASGNMDMVLGAQQVETVLVFGIFDDDAGRQGHLVIMNMIHKIAQRFTKNPVLKDRYRLNGDVGISWVLDEEDRYPYYFGAMEMTWDTFFVRREEDRYV